MEKERAKDIITSVMGVVINMRKLQGSYFCKAQKQNFCYPFFFLWHKKHALLDLLLGYSG